MRVHVLQHVPFESIGNMTAWLDKRCAEVSTTRFYEQVVLPDPSGFDLIIVMGGPMSVNDESEYPWLSEEKAFLRKAVEKGASILGVCLGAQLIVNALGMQVYANTQKEIGWWPVRADVLADPDLFQFPDESRVFHWHGETFDLPPGAVRLARSKACLNQAFQIGRHIIGLQFHLETTPTSAGALLTNCRDELVEAPFIQSEEVIRAESMATYANCNALLEQILDYLSSR